MKLIPKTDVADFPYEKALELLLSRYSDLSTNPVDFDTLIENGKRMGWTEEMINSHQAMKKRGKSFNFKTETENGLRGTFGEDNISFLFNSKEHENKCIPVIKTLAIDLDVRIYRCDLFVTLRGDLLLIIKKKQLV